MVQQQLDPMMHLICISIVLVIYASNHTSFSKRKKTRFQVKLKWDDYEKQYADDPAFIRSLRMGLPSFRKLVEILKDEQVLSRNVEMGSRRGGIIEVPICVFCTLRWLAGGSYLDIRAITGISSAAFYSVIWRTIKAINCSQHPLLANIKFPQTQQECVNAAYGFQSISTGNAITNCVSAIDGYLLEINTPTAKEVGNVRSYFSGHYQRYGVNVQAACDHMCRFTFIGVAGPGCMADRDAINEVSLGRLVATIPVGYVTIGDAAYYASEQMASIYFGNLAKQKKYDDFNYYASQCRIRIEMTFGLMQGRWSILRNPLLVPVHKLKHIMITIARLHNYCINERCNDDYDQPNEYEHQPPTYTPTTAHDASGAPVDDETVVNEEETPLPRCIRGMSLIREQMVDRVYHLALERPRCSNLFNKNSSDRQQL